MQEKQQPEAKDVEQGDDESALGVQIPFLVKIALKCCFLRDVLKACRHRGETITVPDNVTHECFHSHCLF